MPLNLRQKLGRALIKSGGDINWFVNFLQLAAEEDNAEGIQVASVYSKVAWANIAISIRARNIARADFDLYRGNGDTEVEEGPEWDLFHKSRYGRTGVWEQTEGWRCLRGEAIWIINWDKVGSFPRDIVIVDPMQMSHAVDKRAPWVVTAWEYTPLKIPFAPEEVIHFPMWTPNNMVRGESPFAALSDEVSQEYQAAKGLNRLLSNNSIPGGVITIPGDEMDGEAAQRMIERWEKRHKGQSRAGRVAVLGSGATYQRISLSPQEMQSMEARGWNRETILAKLGIPHAAAMIKDATSTLSGKDTAEQMKALWQLTLIPELKYFEDKVNNDLFKRWKIPITCEFDLSDIYELQTDEDALSNRLRLDVQAGVMTQNEAREIRGMEPVEWGNVWWAPMSLTPVENAIKEEPPALEPSNAPDKPKMENQEPKTVSAFFEKARVLYTKEYRDAHWKSQIDKWERIEIQYAKAIKAWGYGLRQRFLASRTRSVKDEFSPDMIVDIPEGEWAEEDAELQRLSKKYFGMAMDATETQVRDLFKDLGMEISFSIYDTRAVQLLQRRVTKVKDITATMQKQLRGVLGDGISGGWSEEEVANAIRDKFNVLQNRAPTIARTEIGNVINDSRMESFKYVGFEKHEWLSAKDEMVRSPDADPPSPFDHRIDGEEVHIGSPFSNGLLYPNDPSGEAGNVINCRCLTLPTPKD